MRLKFPQSWAKVVADKQYFDEDLKQDALDLLEAAAALEIKEFELFEFAFKEWYGKKPLTHVTEAHFSNYMFSSVIPVWVRSYSRHVVEQHRAGTLQPRKLGIYKALPSKRLIRLGQLFATFLVVGFLVLLALLYRQAPVSESLFGRADGGMGFQSYYHHAMP